MVKLTTQIYKILIDDMQREGVVNNFIIQVSSRGRDAPKGNPLVETFACVICGWQEAWDTYDWTETADHLTQVHPDICNIIILAEEG